MTTLAPQRKRILSGTQPSGKLHLGNYFGAIRQYIDLQHEGEAFYFIANLKLNQYMRKTKHSWGTIS